MCTAERFNAVNTFTLTNSYFKKKWEKIQLELRQPAYFFAELFYQLTEIDGDLIEPIIFAHALLKGKYKNPFYIHICTVYVQLYC